MLGSPGQDVTTFTSSEGIFYLVKLDLKPKFLQIIKYLLEMWNNERKVVRIFMIFTWKLNNYWGVSKIQYFHELL